jgi:hypothetical protein
MLFNQPRRFLEEVCRERYLNQGLFSGILFSGSRVFVCRGIGICRVVVRQIRVAALPYGVGYTCLI